MWISLVRMSCENFLGVRIKPLKEMLIVTQNDWGPKDQRTKGPKSWETFFFEMGFVNWGVEDPALLFDKCDSFLRAGSYKLD